jgi:hypothetical protein
LAAVVITAAFVISQWHEMRLVYDPIEKQSVAMKTSAEAAKDAADIAKRTLATTNRAWVSIPGLILTKPLEQGYPVSIQFRLEDFGREPALNTNWSIKPTRVDYIAPGNEFENLPQRNATCDGLLPGSGAGVVIWPSSDTKFWLPVEFKDTPEYRAIFDSVLSKNGSLVIDACFAYNTVGETHKTWARFFLRDKPGPSSGWNFNIATSVNGAD